MQAASHGSSFRGLSSFAMLVRRPQAPKAAVATKATTGRPPAVTSAARPASATRPAAKAAANFAHLRTAPQNFAHLLPSEAQRREWAEEDAAAEREAAHAATVRMMVDHVYAGEGRTPPKALAAVPEQPRRTPVSAAAVLAAAKKMGIA